VKWEAELERRKEVRETRRMGGKNEEWGVTDGEGIRGESSLGGMTTLADVRIGWAWHRALPQPDNHKKSSLSVTYLVGPSRLLQRRREIFFYVQRHVGRSVILKLSSLAFALSPPSQLPLIMALANPVASSTNLFRRLTWQSSIPLEIRLAEGEPGAGSGADRYFVFIVFRQMHAPRYTYLPLLIPEIRDNLVELALDEQQLAETDEKNWWFEEEADVELGSFARQGACRWWVAFPSSS